MAIPPLLLIITLAGCDRSEVLVMANLRFKLAIAATVAPFVFGCGKMQQPQSDVTPSGTLRSVVSTEAPSDVEEYQPCLGLPISALKSMFGDSSVVTADSMFAAMKGTECQVKIRGKVVFRSEFWFIPDAADSREKDIVSDADDESSFAFEGIDGSGIRMVNDGGKEGYSVFVCGDHYFKTEVLDLGAMNGDLNANLENLTFIAVPWLCQNQPVPGLDRTMGQIKQTYSVDGHRY